jgi:NTE family protein
MDPTREPEQAAPPAYRAGKLTRGIALCLSGGGYRAMLFHLGSLWRLNEAGVLGHLTWVSSVSGGSIIAAKLGLEWDRLQFSNGTAPPEQFRTLVVDPIRDLANHTIDVKSVLIGAILPGVTISDRVVAAYDKYLFNQKTLAQFPDDSTGTAPRFVLNATNVQTGSLWRFSRPYMADWQVGVWSKPELPLAVAVAASSAFPPVLSPCILSLDQAPDPPLQGQPAPRYGTPPYTTHVVLSDGGVYDNLGLETAFKRFDTILVSDGGMKMGPDPEPHEDWGLHAKRVLDLIDNQVRSLRKRQLIQAYVDKLRAGAYWGIVTHLEDYGLPDDPFGYLSPDKPPSKDTQMLAATPTRLAALEPWRQEGLINWGYVVCDAALRAHAAVDLKERFELTVRPAGGLPYPTVA